MPLRSAERGSLLLIYAVAVALFAASGMVLFTAQRRLGRVRAYRLEAVAKSAAESALARARLALEGGDGNYRGETGELAPGESFSVRTAKTGDSLPVFDVVCRGEARGPRGERAVRVIQAAFETRDRRTVLASAILLPRAELAQLP